MTVSTLRPDGTSATQGTPAFTGGASAHAVTADDSDASYGEDDALEGNTLTWGDFTLPAGAVVKSVAIRARGHYVSGTGASSLIQTTVAGLPTAGPSGLTPITWTTPTTFTISTAAYAGIDEADVDGMTTLFGVVSGADVRLQEVYADVTYVALPVVAVDAITDPVTTTNQPTITWVDTLDSDGGVQTRYQVKVFTDAQYGAGGFDPDTSSATVDSGELTGADLSWQVTEVLPDDTYRAYVRVAQTVNGVLLWSDWDFDEFTVNVALPADPTFTATADSANARITLVVDDNAGTATTDAFELQRSLDGGTTWETVRQLVAGEITSTGAAVTVYDYEAPNGVATSYRARALHDYSGQWAASAWVTDSDTWTDTEWWVKHPNRPDLNASLKVRSLKSKERAGRAGVFQALGASVPVVVQDTRETARGEIVLRLDSSADQDALDALLDEGATLLIQGPSGSDEPGYVRVLSHARERVFDRNAGAPSYDTLQYVVVASPDGDVVAWP